VSLGSKQFNIHQSSRSVTSNNIFCILEMQLCYASWSRVHLLYSNNIPTSVRCNITTSPSPAAAAVAAAAHATITCWTHMTQQCITPQRTHYDTLHSNILRVTREKKDSKVTNINILQSKLNTLKNVVRKLRLKHNCKQIHRVQKN